MKVYMIWQGGVNYTCGDIADAEAFPNISAAVEEYARRASGSDPYYPCVEGSEGHLFLADPRTYTSGDHYPDRLITTGARGGIRVERC